MRPGLDSCERITLVRDFDFASPEQGGEDQAQHVAFPSIRRAAESLFQRLAHAAVFVAVAMLAFQVIKDFLGDISFRVDYVLCAFSYD